MHAAHYTLNCQFRILTKDSGQYFCWGKHQVNSISGNDMQIDKDDNISPNQFNFSRCRFVVGSWKKLSADFFVVFMENSSGRGTYVGCHVEYGLKNTEKTVKYFRILRKNTSYIQFHPLSIVLTKNSCTRLFLHNNYISKLQ